MFAFFNVLEHSRNSTHSSTSQRLVEFRCFNIFHYNTTKRFNWIDSFNLPSEKHFQANGWSNGFAIENCNTDCTIVLFFLPQAYFSIGSIIFLITLLACITYPIIETTSNTNHTPKYQTTPKNY